MSDLNAILSDFVDVESMVNEVEKGTTKKFWRPEKPRTTIRILPPIKKNGEKLPFITHSVHWINGQPYECLNQTIVDKNGQMHTAEPCPICKMAKALYAAKTDQATELAKTITAKTRYIARVIVRGENEETPVFYELPFSIYNKLKDAILSKEWGSLVGPLDGRDFDIIRTGEGRYSKYDSSSFKPTTSPIAPSNEKIVEIIKKASDVSYNSLISFQDAEALKSVAMENEDLARFFGSAEPKPIPQAAPKQKEETIPFDEDDVPAMETPKVDEQPKSAGEELDDLLAGLI